MKKHTLLIILFGMIMTLTGFGQDRPVYQWVKNEEKSHEFADKRGVGHGLQARSELRNATGRHLKLRMPVTGQDRDLLLVEVDQVPDVTHGATRTKAKYKGGRHYRGIVDGNPNSLVSLSIFGDEVTGMLIADGKSYSAAFENGEFVWYDNQQLPAMSFNCGALSAASDAPEIPEADGTFVGCKTVKVYFECDYKLYTDKGSNVTNVVNYVTGLFSQVATLYANENVEIQISEMYVWTATDPYATATSTSQALSMFRTHVLGNYPNFNGNLAHLLTTRSIGGGIAYLDVICMKNYAFGVSMIYNSYNTVPVYSWSVNVITHELGHNLGSPHTQNCNWLHPDGHTGAIDNCYTTEGGCTPGPAPVNGGTIMSYCHLVSGVGINFANGFGPLPGNLIRQRVLAATCLSASGTTPSNLTTSNINDTGATLSWDAVGSSTYTVQIKLAASSTWTNVTTTTATSVTVNGLQSGANYTWQVKTDCSNYVGASFTTTSTGTTCSTPTNPAANVSQTSATVSWSPVAGAASYTVQYKKVADATFTVSAPLTVTTYTFSVVPSTQYHWQVKANCSGYTVLLPFTTPAAPVDPCALPTGLTVTNLTANSATLSWNLVAGATPYTVKRSKNQGNGWITHSNINTNSYTITGLVPNKTYKWMVKSNCSVYTGQVTFTTPGAMEPTSGVEFIVIPNPTTGVVMVVVPESMLPAAIAVHATDGRFITGRLVDEPYTDIDISYLDAGTYLFTVSNDKERRVTKVIKY